MQTREVNYEDIHFIEQSSPHAAEFQAAMADNPWTRPEADDFWMIEGVQAAADVMAFDNWSVGVAFWIQGHPKIGFANQAIGGEWAVVRGGIRFDSLTGRYYGDVDKLQGFLERVSAATDDDLRRLNY